MTLSRRRFVQAAAATGPVLMLGRRARAGDVRRVTLLHTNDTHSRMEPFDSGPFKGRAGVARRASLIKRVRAEAATVVVDAGDTFQGTPWFNTFKGEVDIRAMNLLGYDATAIGNHDFDAGVPTLARDLKLAPKMGALAANFAVEKDCPLKGRVKPNLIVERGGVKIGLFGLGIAFHGLVNPKMHAGLSYIDPIAVARDQVGYLRDEGCEIVVALSHLGHRGRGGEPGDLDWPKDVAGVDYVVGGHTHTFLKEPIVIEHRSGWRTPVMQVGHSGINLGRADFVIDGRGAEIASARPLGVGGRAVV
jgi:5'-nucleotidase